MIAVITQRAGLCADLRAGSGAGAWVCGFTLCGGQRVASATCASCASVKRLGSTVWLRVFAARRHCCVSAQRGSVPDRDPPLRFRQREPPFSHVPPRKPVRASVTASRSKLLIDIFLLNIRSNFCLNRPGLILNEATPFRSVYVGFFVVLLPDSDGDHHQKCAFAVTCRICPPPHSEASPSALHLLTV